MTDRLIVRRGYVNVIYYLNRMQTHNLFLLITFVYSYIFIYLFKLTVLWDVAQRL